VLQTISEIGEENLEVILYVGSKGSDPKVSENIPKDLPQHEVFLLLAKKYNFSLDVFWDEFYVFRPNNSQIYSKVTRAYRTSSASRISAYMDKINVICRKYGGTVSAEEGGVLIITGSDLVHVCVESILNKMNRDKTAGIESILQSENFRIITHPSGFWNDGWIYLPDLMDAGLMTEPVGSLACSRLVEAGYGALGQSYVFDNAKGLYLCDNIICSSKEDVLSLLNKSGRNSVIYVSAFKVSEIQVPQWLKEWSGEVTALEWRKTGAKRKGVTH
jgi:hypothetical protein